MDGDPTIQSGRGFRYEVWPMLQTIVPRGATGRRKNATSSRSWMDPPLPPSSWRASTSRFSNSRRDDRPVPFLLLVRKRLTGRVLSGIVPGAAFWGKYVDRAGRCIDDLRGRGLRRCEDARPDEGCAEAGGQGRAGRADQGHRQGARRAFDVGGRAGKAGGKHPGRLDLRRRGLPRERRLQGGADRRRIGRGAEALRARRPYLLLSDAARCLGEGSCGHDRSQAGARRCRTGRARRKQAWRRSSLRSSSCCRAGSERPRIPSASRGSWQGASCRSPA